MRNLITAHPFLGALPPLVREPLEVSTKEVMKLRGVTLYKEGSKPSGVWLISNGVVKVRSFSKSHHVYHISEFEHINFTYSSFVSF